MRVPAGARTLLAAALVFLGCGDEPLPSDPSVVWAQATPWVAGEASLLKDDWAFATAAADSLPPELVERVSAAVGAIDGGLRLLAVTRDACIDSAHSIPYLVALADAVPGLELRAVHPRIGGALMDAYPAQDGRGATPTVLVLDDAGEVRGCWIERPIGLQSWYIENPDDLGSVEKFATKTEWYEADRGVHALAEIALIVEAVARGDVICGLPLDSVPALPEPGVVPADAD